MSETPIFLFIPLALFVLGIAVLAYKGEASLDRALQSEYERGVKEMADICRYTMERPEDYGGTGNE